jgi:hypothetical protein
MAISAVMGPSKPEMLQWLKSDPYPCLSVRSAVKNPIRKDWRSFALIRGSQNETREGGAWLLVVTN